MIRKGYINIISWSLTTPYPGSKLFEFAKKYNFLIDKLIEDEWEIWDSSKNFIIKFPMVNAEDWRYVKRKGKLLQVRLLFTSGTFNIRSIPIYFKKLVALLKSAIVS